MTLKISYRSWLTIQKLKQPADSQKNWPSQKMINVGSNYNGSLHVRANPDNFNSN